MVPMRCNEPKVPRPTSEIKLFDKKSRRKNLIPLKEVESNFFISLKDKFNTFNTVFLAKAPLKKSLSCYGQSPHNLFFSSDQFASWSTKSTYKNWTFNIKFNRPRDNSDRNISAKHVTEFTFGSRKFNVH